MERCLICRRLCFGRLCFKHNCKYVWDSSIEAFRQKKRNTGSRYTKDSFHGKEIVLTKILEEIYGKDDVFTSVHPIWAVSEKGALLEYDILIKSKNLFIEYNGIQHYEFSNFFHKTENRFHEQQARDKLKQSYAIEKGYTLYVIKYDYPLFKDTIISLLYGGGLY